MFKSSLKDIHLKINRDQLFPAIFLQLQLFLMQFRIRILLIYFRIAPLFLNYSMKETLVVLKCINILNSFRQNKNIPYYAKCYSSFELLNKSQSLIHPFHPELDSSFGWQFDCLFSDWGVYFPALYELFQNLGGQINQKELTKDSIQELDADCIINCAEIYGGQLLGAPFFTHHLSRSSNSHSQYAHPTK